MESSATIFVDEFSNFFNIFCRFAGAWSRHERSSSSTDTRPALKRECHSKTAGRILRKHFKGFGSGFTEPHAKLDADALLDFAVHRRQNET
jgi:hypothetical protein